MTLSDHELVSMYKEGSGEAFDTLLSRHKDRLFQYIVYMVSGDEDLANDVFQDTFVKAIMAIRDGRYQQTGHFAAWLLRIARNNILDIQRSRRWRNVVPGDLTDKDGDPRPDIIDRCQSDDLCAEDMLIGEQERERVRSLVDRLPENQREVVVLRYFQEMPFKEIAQLTGVSINTALGRMHYAMNNLRRMAV